MKTRLSFLLAVACATFGDRRQGRALAINDDATFTPFESSRGTESLDADVAIGFRNAVVKTGSDDRHFALVTGAGDIPRGVLLNDEVPAEEVGAMRKQIAIFGVYKDTLPAVAAGAISVNAEVVADLATPGRVKLLPTASGTYVVFGRSRFNVVAAGDPVSLVHCVPRVVVVP